MKLTSFFPDSRSASILILISSALVWMNILPLYSPFAGQMVPDSERYIQYSDQFIYQLNQDVIRTPGYPLLLLLIKAVSSTCGISYLTGSYLTQTLLFLTGIFLLSEIVRKRWSSKLSIWFVALVIVNPSFFIYNFLILTEPLFFFLISSGAYFLHRFFEREKPNAIYLSLLSTCLATLARPGLYYLNLLYLAVILILCWKRKNFIRICVCLIIYGATVLAVQTNFYLHHKLFKISMIDEITRHRYLRNAVVCERSGEDMMLQLGKQDSIDHQILKQYDHEGNLQAISAFYNHQWNQTVKNHSTLTMKVFLRNIVGNIHTGNTHIPKIIPEARRGKIFNLTRVWNMLYAFLFALELLLFMILGIRNAIHNHLKPSLMTTMPYFSSNNTWRFLLLFVTYQIITSGVSFWQGDRLLIVCQPMILLIAFPFFASLWKNKFSSIRRQKFP